MELKKILSRRIGIRDIAEIVVYVHGDEQRIDRLYALFSHPDDMLAYQALWAATHLTPDDNDRLLSRRNDLIDQVLACSHAGKRRLLLNVLYRQPPACPPRVDFLDFCLERMTAWNEPYGVRSLCMKLAYELCRSLPELLQEYRAALDLMEPGLLPPSLRSVRKNLLKKIEAEKKKPVTTGRK